MTATVMISTVPASVDVADPCVTHIAVTHAHIGATLDTLAHLAHPK